MTKSKQDIKWSISSTFYSLLLRKYSLAKKWQSQTVTREKLQKKARVKCWWNWHKVELTLLNTKKKKNSFSLFLLQAAGLIKSVHYKLPLKRKRS